MQLVLLMGMLFGYTSNKILFSSQPVIIKSLIPSLFLMPLHNDVEKLFSSIMKRTDGLSLLHPCCFGNYFVCQTRTKIVSFIIIWHKFCLFVLYYYANFPKTICIQKGLMLKTRQVPRWLFQTISKILAKRFVLTMILTQKVRQCFMAQVQI